MTERKTAAKAAEKRQEPREDVPPEGVYEATGPLLVGGVLAFNEGDRVPAGHVNRFEWQDKVRRVDDESGD
jgi:hypothetical protein